MISIFNNEEKDCVILARPMTIEKKNILIREDDYLMSLNNLMEKITHVNIQSKKQLKDNIIFIWKYRFKYDLLSNNIENEMDYYNQLKEQYNLRRIHMEKFNNQMKLNLKKDS